MYGRFKNRNSMLKGSTNLMYGEVTRAKEREACRYAHRREAARSLKEMYGSG